MSCRERSKLFVLSSDLNLQLCMASARALVTRNMKASVDHFHTHKFPLQPFQPSLCRETFHAHKPSPEPLLHIAGLWGVSPRELAMVGDSAKDDVVSGNRAGALTILLRNPSAPDNGGADPDEDNPERIPTFTVCLWHLSSCPSLSS